MLEEQGRRAARIPFDSDVEEYFSKNETYGLKALNLSEHGLGLIADRTFRRHHATYAWLEFFLPTGQRVRALGERVYEQGTTMMKCVMDTVSNISHRVNAKS